MGRGVSILKMILGNEEECVSHGNEEGESRETSIVKVSRVHTYFMTNLKFVDIIEFNPPLCMSARSHNLL